MTDTISGMSPAQASRARTKRSARKENPRPIEITDRDLDVLEWLFQLRIATSRQLLKLDGGTYKPFLRLLRALYDHALVDSPRGAHRENGPNYYALSDAGAKLLSHERGVDIEHTRWSYNNKRIEPVFLAHTAAIADFVIAAELDCRKNDHLQLLDQHDIVQYFTDAQRKRSNPFIWDAQVPFAGRMMPVSVVPDRCVSIANIRDNTRINLLHEADRGTMPIGSRTLKGSSIRKKLHAYLAGWRSGMHVQFGMQRVRISFATTTEKRMNAMRAELRAITGNQATNLFLFTTQERLVNEGLLAPIWATATEEGVSLL